ncbi:chloramphenicol phosphotransferase CPT family protein [Kiloniella litopenaei]|uniref:chloramphenicol phosphotransferase CPT family protein n=1 Tax=Kiloniella litopenaei TaxID=1549748 RepID=UPI003BAC21DC
MNSKTTQTGKVIILNGTSSAGKTTLAKEIQARFKSVYLHCSSDMFWNMTPRRIPASSISFPNLKLAMAQSIKSLALTGHNVVVDTIFPGRQSQDDIIKTLGDIESITVKIECSLAELNRREQVRGDRKPGLAASQITTAHTDIIYDLTIKTDENSPHECVQKLKRAFPHFDS